MLDRLIFYKINLPFLFCAIFFIAFIAPQNLSGQEPGNLKTNSDKEKRSSIHSVDAYSYLSENMTVSEIRAAAFANAKRQALEMARTYIQSKTQVEDFIVKYDLVWSSAEGAVTVLEQKDHGIENNTRYHVWIKAEVDYELRLKSSPIEQPHGSGQSTALDKGVPLTVKVWTSKKKYKDGENIEINLQGNREFYARIVDITSGGNIIQLLPNKFRNINFFKAGKVYKVPDIGDHFQLKASPPYGEDQIVVYASEVPLGSVSLEQTVEGLGLYRGSKKTLGFQTRGISVLPLSANEKSGAEFYEATWKFTTNK